MKRIVIAAAALLAVTGFAHSKVWADLSCSYILATSDEWRGWRYATYAGVDTLCRVESWPISSPIAKMICDNGIKADMRIIDDHQIQFNMIDMIEVTPENDICHEGYDEILK